MNYINFDVIYANFSNFWGKWTSWELTSKLIYRIDPKTTQFLKA